jgi:NCAIR mutase (PurE)-related protein
MKTRRREHRMKRIATLGAIVAAFAVAPAVATAGNVAQVKLQNHKPQVVDVQVAKIHRATAAVSLQRHRVQVAHATRFSLLSRTYIR